MHKLPQIFGPERDPDTPYLHIPNVNLIVNFVSFQALWASCVMLAGGYGWYWPAFVAVALMTVLGVFMPRARVDFPLAIMATLAGYSLDSLWAWLGILQFPQAQLAPFWIAFLWYGLGLSINYSLRWFRDAGWLGAAIVGAFAPVTYLTGQRFGAVAIPELWDTLWICLSWLVLFVGLSKWAIRQNSADETGDSA